MKKIFSLLLFVSFLLIISGCKEDDQNNGNDEESDWNFEVTFVLSDQYNSTYVATGTAHYERTGDNFTATCTYSIGLMTHSNIVIEGTIDGSNLTFTTETLMLEMNYGGNSYTEEVHFTVGEVISNGNTSTGNGTIHQRILPDGPWEDGTYTFTATK